MFSFETPKNINLVMSVHCGQFFFRGGSNLHLLELFWGVQSNPPPRHTSRPRSGTSSPPQPLSSPYKPCHPPLATKQCRFGHVALVPTQIWGECVDPFLLLLCLGSNNPPSFTGMKVGGGGDEGKECRGNPLSELREGGGGGRYTLPPS